MAGPGSECGQVIERRFREYAAAPAQLAAMSRVPKVEGLLEYCPECDLKIVRGLSYRHSLGPGPDARLAAGAAAPIGLVAAFGVLFGSERMAMFSGYGVGIAAGMVGLLLPALICMVADSLPRSVHLRCKECDWRQEFVIE